MRVGRERRSARVRRERAVRRQRIVVLIAVLVMVPLLTAMVLAGVFSAGLRTVAAIEDDIPSLEDQHSDSLAQTTALYAADGTLLAYLHGVENRTIISGKAMPDNLKHALVSVEDERWRASHIFGLRMPEGIDLAALKESLERRKVVASLRGSALRVSPNVYNDAGDVEALLDGLREATG